VLTHPVRCRALCRQARVLPAATLIKAMSRLTESECRSLLADHKQGGGTIRDVRTFAARIRRDNDSGLSGAEFNRLQESRARQAGRVLGNPAVATPEDLKAFAARIRRTEVED
jgi:hypothetical protein